MYLPQLEEENSTRRIISTFGGYNHNTVIAENEFYEMTNMTSDHYPALAVREKRGIVTRISSGSLPYLLWHDGMITLGRITTGLRVTLYTEDGTSRFHDFALEADDVARLTGDCLHPVIMGNYLVIVPTGAFTRKEDPPSAMYLNLGELRDVPDQSQRTDHGYVEQKNRCTFAAKQARYAVNLYLCDREGEPLNIMADGGVEPTNAVAREGYWLYRHDGKPYLREYNAEKGIWEKSEAETFIGIYVTRYDGDDYVATDELGAFAAGDSVEITGGVKWDSIDWDQHFEYAQTDNYGSYLFQSRAEGEENKMLSAEAASKCYADIAGKHVITGVARKALGDKSTHNVIIVPGIMGYPEMDWMNYDGTIPSTVWVGTMVWESVTETVKGEDGTDKTVTRDVKHKITVNVVTNKNYDVIEDLALVMRQPVLDHVVAFENRLWGCRYGKNADGETVNEIYATKLGDFSRWFTYVDGGVEDNSWSASVGRAGEWTGATVYNGRLYFFKSDCIYAIYGSSPSTWGYSELPGHGVQSGCHRSLCVLDGVLLYKSPVGVVAFDGSGTTLLSGALGFGTYADAHAGTFRGKYYVSMRDMAKYPLRTTSIVQYDLFVYDTRRGLWHREDEGQARGFLTHDDALYFWDDPKGYHAAGSYVCALGNASRFGNSTAGSEGDIDWSVETGVIGLDDPDKKYISRLSVRMELELGARVRISIQYDSRGDFECVFSTESDRLRTVTVPIKPRRCDHLRMRIEGFGAAKIYSITKTIEQGSDF